MTKNTTIIVLVLLLSLTTGFCVRAVVVNRELANENEGYQDALEYNGNIFKMACQYGKQIEQELKQQKQINDTMHAGYHAICYPRNIYTAVDRTTGQVELLDTTPPSDQPLIRVSPEVIRSVPRAKQ